MIREEVREIVFERTVRAPNFLVRVVPLLLAVCILEGCLLLNERPPLSVPRIEGVRECRLVGIGEREGKIFQFSSSVGLRSARKVLEYLFDLVELADLYRNSVENIEESASAVDDDCGECPSLDSRIFRP